MDYKKYLEMPVHERIRYYINTKWPAMVIDSITDYSGNTYKVVVVNQGKKHIITFFRNCDGYVNPEFIEEVIS